MSMNTSSSFLRLHFILLSLSLFHFGSQAQVSEETVWEGLPVYSKMLPDANILQIVDSSSHLLTLISDSEGSLIARPGSFGQYFDEVPNITKTPEGIFLLARNDVMQKLSMQGDLLTEIPLKNIPDNFIVKGHYGIANFLTGGFMVIAEDKNNPLGSITLLFLDLNGFIMHTATIESTLTQAVLKEAQITNDSKAGFLTELIFSNNIKEEYRMVKIDAFGNINLNREINTSSTHFLSLKNTYSFEKTDLSILNFSDKNDLNNEYSAVYSFDKVGNILFEKTFPEDHESDTRKIIGHAAQVIDQENFVFIYESVENDKTQNDELGLHLEKIDENGNSTEHFFTKGIALETIAQKQRPSVYQNPNGCFTVFASKKDKLTAYQPYSSNCPPISLTGLIDLELEFSANTLTPTVWQNLTVSLSVVNNGTDNAENIEIHTPIPSDPAFSGAGVPSGHFNQLTGTWSIPYIKAGETITLDLHLFTRSVEQFSIFAQVNSVDQEDIDSEPKNNTSGMPNEDDEAIIVFNSSDGLPDLHTTNVQPISPFYPDSNAVITFDLNNRGTEPALGDYEISAYLSMNSELDNSDQKIGTFTAEDTPVGQLSGQMINVKIPSSTTKGSYFLILETDIGNHIIESNELNNSTYSRIQIRETNSGVLDLTDLEVKITSESPSYKIYEPISFTITIANKGNVEATDIILAVPFPEEFPFADIAISEGEFNNWFKHWNLEKLLPSESQSMTLTLFPIDNSQPQIIFAQVTQALPDDADSTPGNADCCTAKEDDEAAVTVVPAAGSINRRSVNRKKQLNQKAVSVLSIFPNPAKEYLTIKAFSNLEKTPYFLVNSHGTVIMSGNFKGQGIQDWVIDVTNLQSGVYNILFNTAERPEKATFIKVRE